MRKRWEMDGKVMTWEKWRQFRKVTIVLHKEYKEFGIELMSRWNEVRVLKSIWE